MIEVRMNLVDLARIKHELLHSIAMIRRLKTAGVPVIGTLLMRGVSNGRLSWHTEEDLDGDISVLRWYANDEPGFADREDWRRVAGEKHDGWEWSKHVHHKHLQRHLEEEDEL